MTDSPPELEDTAQLVEWLRDLSTPVATSALDALFFQKIRAAVAVETKRCIDRIASEPRIPGQYQIIARDILQATEPADD